jgi:hypothetical protein
VERERLDLAKRDPAQFERLEIADDRLEELVDLNGDRCVRPESEVEHRLKYFCDCVRRNAGLFVGLT